MMNFPPLSPAPDEKEIRLGFLWLAFSLLILPSVLGFADFLSGSVINLIYYGLNFTVTVFLCRRFLKSALMAALQRPFRVVWCALLAYLGFQTLTELLTVLILRICPAFRNVNDASIHAMLAQDLIPLAVGTVLLVPLAEETLYRGLIFRKLFDRNPIAAYLVSMAAFAAIHVMGYVSAYPPLTLVLCFVQYLPAGYCLCWCYRQTGTIITPILMHTFVNAVSIYQFVR